ncbi:MAG: M14 family zinc carboxypeptidase, partial [Longimicrobiales bacterium]
RTNTFPFDDDNDGRVDEDGPEDLNGDGLITAMRVPDPDGAFMVDPDDPRLMKRADPSRGETGAYTLYWEGTDSDNDGFYNEDGPGGVDLNRNFQHEYPYWKADAGLHMVSEPETRALMDFVLAHRNIGAILTFGLTDNLVTPPDSRGALAGASVLDLPLFANASNADVFDVGVFAAGGGFGRGFFGGGFGGGRGGGGGYLRGAQVGADNDPNSGRRPSTTVSNGDLVYFTAVSDAYKEITGISEVPVHRTPEGAFFQYGYFQFGVPSFSTPGWGLPAQESEGEGPGRAGDRPQGQPSNPAGAQAGAAGGRTPPAGAAGRMPGGGGGGMAGMQQARARGAAGGSGADKKVLEALEAAGVDAFVDWTPFTHTTLGPVEIGGFRPYVTTNPPAEQVAELGAKHGEFLVRLAGMLPRVRIAGTEVDAHGGGVFTVTVHVQNEGFLPTALQHGVTSRTVQPTLVQIQVPPEDILTGADKSSRIQQMDGSGARESFTWVIRGQEGSRVEIKVRSEKGGTDTATVTLG